MPTNQIDGLKAFEAKLNRLARNSVRDVGTPVLNAGLNVIVDAIRSQIPSEYSELAKLVGKRIDKSQTGESKHEVVGKVGFAVGRRSGRKKSRKRGGVGISASNIHWLILGTKERSTKAGANRGRMPAVLANCVPQGVAYSNAAAMEEMQRVFDEIMAKVNSQ